MPFVTPTSRRVFVNPLFNQQGYVTAIFIKDKIFRFQVSSQKFV